MRVGLLWEAGRQAGCAVYRERHGGPGSAQPGHSWLWLGGPDGERKILGRAGSRASEERPLRSPEGQACGAHGFLAGRLQEKKRPGLTWSGTCQTHVSSGSLQAPRWAQGAAGELKKAEAGPRGDGPLPPRARAAP